MSLRLLYSTNTDMPYWSAEQTTTRSCQVGWQPDNGVSNASIGIVYRNLSVYRATTHIGFQQKIAFVGQRAKCAKHNGTRRVDPFTDVFDYVLLLGTGLHMRKFPPLTSPKP